MSQLKKGALLSYVSIFLTNGIGLVLTPYIIRSLGDAEYGLYTLIGAFVGYMTVLDLGLNNTIIRYVAKYRAENDKAGEEKFLGTSILIYVAIALLVCFIGVILFLNLESIFSGSLTDDELSKAKIMFLVLLFNIAVTLPGGAFEAICSGYEHFVYPRAMKIVRYLIRSAAVVGLLYYGGDAIGLVVLDTIMNLSIILSNGYYVLKKLKVSFSFKGFDKILVKEIFGYSIWIFVMALVYQFQFKGGQIILGIETNTTVVAVYAVGILLGSYYGAFASAINSVFLPRAMKMIVANSNSRMLENEVVKIGRYTFSVLFLILIGFFFFGESFITFWVGSTYKDAWFIAFIVMLASTQILVFSFTDGLLKAKKLFKFKGLTYISLLLLGTYLGYFLIDFYGSKGMILGICSSWFLSQILVFLYVSSKFKISLKAIYFRVFNLNFALSFIVLVFFGFLINMISSNSIFGLVMSILALIIIYLVVYYFIYANQNEKAQFNLLIQKLL